MKKSLIYLGLILLTWFLVSPEMGIAQTTGKIAGTVTDASTGEGLAGANVIIAGTQMGTSADAKGDYYILNIPPGLYTLEIRMMGYTPIRMENVQVSTNRTATIDFELKTTVIEGEVVTVQADKITVKKDQTNSIRNVSAEEIDRLPVESVGAIVSMQPGVSGSHFRGGRDNEVTYLIDGMRVTNLYSNSGRAVDVNTDAVQDIEVITGTFNAEYGNAMSGIVNIVTKEGGKELKGSVTGELGNYITNHTDKFHFIGLEKTDFDRIQDYQFNLSGPIVNKINFLMNGRYVKDMGHLNSIYRFNPDDYSAFGSADSTQWYSEHTGDNSYVPMDWSKNLRVFGKITYRPFKSLKMSVSGSLNDGKSQGYDHSHKYSPYGRATSYSNSTMLTYYLNHMLTPSAFYDLRISYSDFVNKNYLYEDPLDSRYIHGLYGQNNGFNTGGQSKNHDVRSEKDLNIKYDFSWQMNKSHFVKTGIDFQQVTLDQEDLSIQNAYAGTGLENEMMFDPITNEVIFPYYAPAIFGDSSSHSDIYVHKPVKLAYYLQDKMEFKDMVVNLGVRYDYFDPDAVYPSNYRNPSNMLHQVDPSRYSTYPSAEKQYQLSPRLGLAYQLGSSALLRFSYGHFFQLPPLSNYYQNHAFLVTGTDYSSRMGNPNLKAQKTIQYEVGLWQQLSDHMNLEVAVYYRDIYDLVTLTVYTTYNQVRYGVYTNKDYGNARGLELKYEYRQGNLAADINYTLGYTRGVADSPTMTFDRAGNQQDPVNKLIPMSWDQRHVLNANLGYTTKKYGATAIMYFNSGETYTWEPIAQSPLARINLFPNNQHEPSRYSVDLSAYYNIMTIKGINFKLTLLVYNLLDRLNENSVNANTGRAGQVIVQETDLLNHRSNYHEYLEEVLPPNRYSTPRQVKIGLGITF